VIIGAIGAAMIKAMISRSREFVADADGAKIAGSPNGLMSALRKLESLNAQRIPMATRTRRRTTCSSSSRWPATR
jgi:heat shock protein HtpX